MPHIPGGGEPPAARRLLNWWSANPRTDWLLTALVVAIALLLHAAGRRPVVLDGHERQVLYGAVLGSSTGFLGFCLTPAAMVLGTTAGVRLRAVLKSHRRELRDSVVTAVRRVVLTVCLCVVGLATDVSDPGTQLVRYLVLGAAASLVPAALRLVDAFGGLFSLISLDQLSNEKIEVVPIPVPTMPEPPPPRSAGRARKAPSRP